MASALTTQQIDSRPVQAVTLVNPDSFVPYTVTGGTGGTSTTDENTFTIGTSSLTPMGAIFAATPVASLAAGVNVPSGFHQWVLQMDTAGLAAGTPLPDGAVEYLIGGTWQQDVAFQGAVAGPYANGSMIWTLASTIGAIDASGNLVGPYPTKARVRIDTSSGVTVPSVTLSLS